MENFGNAQVKALPLHLRQYIVPQHYDHYTSIDQAVWRYVMRQNFHCLKDIAYYPYIPGLKKAGLSIEHIPALQDMNDALGQIGWGAVTVNGFIPPAAFMEFQACRVLVIAADIRTLEHIAYTPAPDIIHESAGHAPIIAEPDYNAYLSYFGSIGAKALYSAADHALYEAIRELSIIKEQPDASADDIRQAEEKLARQQSDMGAPSEMALLSRLHWWTVEYGLIGTCEHYKIYGAGLLSSIGESANCLRPEVAKLPYTLGALEYPYDITSEQPQLFVTPDFKHLYTVLDQFADQMAFRQGGLESLKKAIDSKNTCTAVYSSGLQISGTFTSATQHGGQIAYMQTTGPTALACNDRQLPDHGKERHAEGFGAPVGLLKNQSIPIEDLSATAAVGLGLYCGNTVRLVYESGIIVHGTITKLYHHQDKLLLVSFRDCRVTGANGSVLFEPSWGDYDMAVGARIESVYSGAADKAAFDLPEQAPVKMIQAISHVAGQEWLQSLYSYVRSVREGQIRKPEFEMIFNEVLASHPADWLLPLEILELITERDVKLESGIRRHLKSLAGQKPGLEKLIRDGLKLIDANL